MPSKKHKQVKVPKAFFNPVESKSPKVLYNPIESKTPKARVIPSDYGCPEFKAEQMDRNGPWGWNNFDPLQLQELLVL